MFYKLDNNNIAISLEATSGRGIIESESVLDLSLKNQYDHINKEFHELKWRVRFNENGVQVGSCESLKGFDDIKNEFIDAPEGFDPNVLNENSRCVKEGEIVRLMTSAEYTVFSTRPEPTAKQIIIKDYEFRAVLGVPVYKDLMAEIVQYFHNGVGIEIIVPLEQKFKPILDGLNTGDFITAFVGLNNSIADNQNETDFKNYALGKINAVLTEQGWLQT